jgi:hypothetical protein
MEEGDKCFSKDKEYTVVKTHSNEYTVIDDQNEEHFIDMEWLKFFEECGEWNPPITVSARTTDGRSFCITGENVLDILAGFYRNGAIYNIRIF